MRYATRTCSPIFSDVTLGYWFNPNLLSARFRVILVEKLTKPLATVCGRIPSRITVLLNDYLSTIFPQKDFSCSGFTVLFCFCAFLRMPPERRRFLVIKED